MRKITENSEVLAQQARSAVTQDGSGPTIELVTSGARKMEASKIICPPNCIVICNPSCEPTIFKPPPPKPPPPKPPN